MKRGVRNMQLNRLGLGKWASRVIPVLAAVLTSGLLLAVPIWLEASILPEKDSFPILQSDEGTGPAGQARQAVPILLYHNLAEDGADEARITGSTISQAQFEEEMALLAGNGYETVSFQQMFDFVEKGTPLPERPVCITFDDGYLSNYRIAFPILKRYRMKATIFVIGSTVGNTVTYKDTDFPITPHFDDTQAREMTDSGLISIQTHTYDMHQWPAYETGTRIRKNILPLPEESDEDYARALEADLHRARTEIEEVTGQPVNVLAYPGGTSNQLSQELLVSFGVKATLSINPGKAVLTQGCPTSLQNMNRFYVLYTTSQEEFLEWIAEEPA